MSSNTDDLAQIEIHGRDWVLFASVAWEGYQINGPGVVVLELSNEEEQVEEREVTTSLFYLPATTNQIRQHAEQNQYLAKWLDSLSPDNGLILAIAHPAGVFYSYLKTPGSYPSPPNTGSESNRVVALADEISDYLNFEQSAIIKDWPLIAGIAESRYLGPERDVIAIALLLPSEFDLREAVARALKNAERVFLEGFREQIPAMLADIHSVRIGFESRLAERWGKALDIFESILMLCREEGSDYRKKHWQKAADENDLVFAILTRLHARACLTASEILALLRSGHASGAHARWRTLHEITTVAYFISKFGGDVAERYLEHEPIQSFNAAREFQIYSSRLGCQRYTKAEMDVLRAEYNRVVSKYGESFKQDYGWADDALDKLDPSHKGKATFTRIEEAVGLEHWRPYFGMANYGIHAGAKGITFNLGLIKQQQYLLAGPSNAGLSDAGDSTCISLTQITIALLTLRPDIETVIAMKVLMELVKEAGGAFLEAHKKLEEDDRKQRAHSE